MREKGRLNSLRETELEAQGWRGVYCCEWPALPHEVRVEFQPMLPLRATSGSMAKQQQKSVSMSWFILLQKTMQMSLLPPERC